jgi:hypothetical protein
MQQIASGLTIYILSDAVEISTMLAIRFCNSFELLTICSVPEQRRPMVFEMQVKKKVSEAISLETETIP